MSLSALEYEEDKARYNLHCIKCQFCNIQFPSMNIRDAVIAKESC